MNTRLCGVALAAVLTAWIPCRGLAEGYVVVKIQDMTKKITMELMSDSDFKTLEKTIQMESRYFQQAVQAAAKEWREDEANKGTAFAGGRLVPRRIAGSPERFSNEEKAQARLTAIEDLEGKKELRQMDRARNQRKSRDVLTKEMERESALSSAEDVVKAKLEEMISGKASAPAAGGKAGGGAAVGVGAGGGAAGGAAKPAGKVPEAAAREAGQKAL